jgi:hypothetical protein
LGTRGCGKAGKVKQGKIRHGVCLHISPCILHGVQLRGVGWKVEAMEVLVIPNVILNLMGSMREEAGPEQDDRGIELGYQMVEELLGCLRVDVGIGVEAEIGTESMSLRCNA